MMKVLTLLCALTTASIAAPRYGEDGGYLGYASYKPMAGNTLAKRLGVIAADDHDEPIDVYKSQISKTRRAEPRYSEVKRIKAPSLEYNIPKKYEATGYAPRSAYGYDDSNDLSSAGAPSAPYKQVAHYGSDYGGYKLADAYVQDYTGGYKDEQDYPHEPQPYEYGYQVKDDYGNEQFKQEISNSDGAVKGTYGFKDERGLYRQVDYVADKSGFRANVKTNEPGTDNQDPASIHVDSEESKYK